MSVAEQISDLRTRTAVAEQRLRSTEARILNVETSLNKLQSHFDRGLGVIALLTIAMPFVMEAWFR